MAAPHLALISRHIAEAAYTPNSRKIICCPPRHGKSTLISHGTPLWYLDRFPDRFCILTSYAAQFARSWGRKVRNSVRQHHGLLKYSLSRDQKRADEWVTSQGGGMKTAGVGGDITGRGAHLLIIDDPIKNHEEAYSETIRESHWEWMQSTVYSRLEPAASIVLLQTRWHADDLAGRLIEASRKGEIEHWDVVSLPALALEDDPLGRRPGQALWPWRYDEAALEMRRRFMGLWWNALYQQQPIAAGYRLFPRGLFKRVPAHLIPPKEQLHIVQAWDMSFKDLESSDYVAGITLGIKGARAFVLEVVHGHMSFVRAAHEVVAMRNRWPASAIHVEEAANGPAIISALRHHVPGINGVPPRGSKYARAAAVQPFVAAGNIFIADDAIWAEPFLSELEAFPVGKHDDQVDAFSLALAQAWLGGAGLAEFSWNVDDLLMEDPWENLEL